MAESCGNCVFLKPNEIGARTGICRRKAPSPNVTQLGDANAVWPSVYLTDWCGEYGYRGGVNDE